jgi:thioredoxin reductase (NADPH)
LNTAEVAIIGAGPIGLELAVALKRGGIDYVHIDAGQIAETIYRFPPDMRFFSSPERIAIAGVPIHTPDQSKCTREQYLAYLRSVVEQFELEVNTFERVIDITPSSGGFRLVTESRWKHRTEYGVRKIVLATGGTARSRRLGIPGEDLAHVSHELADPHRYFKRRVLIVGGRNSAVEAALRCHHAGAEVEMSYRRDAFPTSVKYWLLPEIRMLIETGAIHCHYETMPTMITADHVALRSVEGGEELYVPADEVLLMVGYEADMSLFETAGVRLIEPQRQPDFDERTMQTNVPGVFVAGTACAGTQAHYRVFLENCHVHVERIIAALKGEAAPDTEAQTFVQPET